jgi:hypothetical protein
MRASTCLVALGLTSFAIPLVAVPSRGADSRAALLASLIEDDTVAVARFDATRFDTEAVRQLISLFADFEAQMGDSGLAAKELHTLLRTAGVGEAVVVFSAPELPVPSFLFVSMKDDSNEAAVRGLMRAAVDEHWRIEKKGNGLIAGNPEALARLAQGKRSTRPEVAAASAAAGNSLLQVLLIPSDDHRRVIAEVGLASPVLARFPARAFARGFRWAALGIDLEPKVSLKLTVQAADAPAANDMADIAQAGLAALGRQRLFGDTQPLSEASPAEFAAATAALKPTIDGDRMTVAVTDQAAVKAIGSLFVDSEERIGLPLWSASGRNMRRIVLGLHNYASSHRGYFPPTAIRAKDGKPLLSWRVALLPLVGEDRLYGGFKLDEPWDSEHNKKLIEKMPSIYRSLKVKGKQPGLTTFLVPVGKEVAFTGDPVGRALASGFPDGLSNTILLLDVSDDKGQIWTKPADLPIDLDDPMNGLLGHYRTFFWVAMADGSIRRIARTISKPTLRSAFTCNGAETLGPDW